MSNKNRGGFRLGLALCWLGASGCTEHAPARTDAGVVPLSARNDGGLDAGEDGSGGSGGAIADPAPAEATPSSASAGEIPPGGPNGEIDAAEDTGGAMVEDARVDADVERPISNTPNATLVVTPLSEPAAKLALVSSNYIDKWNGNTWYGVVKNRGDVALCVPGAVVYLDHERLGTSSLQPKLSAAPYSLDVDASVSVGCIPPGELGVLYAANDYSGYDANGIVRMEVRLSATPVRGHPLPHPLAPSFSNLRVTQLVSGLPGGPPDYVLQGTLTASAGEVFWVVVEAYALDADGLVTKQFLFGPNKSLQARESWDFETERTQPAFHRFLIFAVLL